MKIKDIPNGYSIFKVRIHSDSLVYLTLVAAADESMALDMTLNKFSLDPDNIKSWIIEKAEVNESNQAIWSYLFEREEV